MNQMLVKKVDVDKIYLPCQEGRRSLMNIGQEYKAAMIGLQKYMTNKENIQVQVIQDSRALHSVPKEAETYLHEAGTIDDVSRYHGKAATWKAKSLKLKYKEDYKKLVKNKWKDKTMYSNFPKYLSKDYVGTELSFQSMKYTGLKGETEGLVTAAQDQSLNTIMKYQILQVAHLQTRNH